MRLSKEIIPKRKSDWPEFIQYAAGVGLTHPQIAAILDITEDELKAQWEKDINKGRAIAALIIADKTFEAAKHKDTTRIFWMKATQKWIDQHRAEDVVGRQPIQVSVQIAPKTKELPDV